MLDLTSSLAIICLIIFLVENIISFHVYRQSRNRTNSTSRGQEVLLLFNSKEQEPSQTASTTLYCHDHTQKTQVQEFLVISSSQNKDLHTWSRLSYDICVVSFFLIAFIVINFILHPYTYHWTLNFLIMLFPVPFITLSSLFHFKPKLTLILLLIGLGLGLSTILVL